MILTRDSFVLKDSMKNTYNLTDTLKSHYNKIHSKLGVPSSLISPIIAECALDTEILDRILDIWFNHTDKLFNRQKYPPTWKGLKALLEDINQSEVVKDYFEFLGRCP